MRLIGAVSLQILSCSFTTSVGIALITGCLDLNTWEYVIGWVGMLHCSVTFGAGGEIWFSVTTYVDKITDKYQSYTCETNHGL